MAKLKDWVMRYVFAGRASTAADADTNEVVVTDDGAMKVELSGSNVTVVPSLLDTTLEPDDWDWSAVFPCTGYDRITIAIRPDSNGVTNAYVRVSWYTTQEHAESKEAVATDVIDDGTQSHSPCGGTVAVKGNYFQVFVINKDASLTIRLLGEAFLKA